MERRKLGQIAVAGLGMLLLSTPAFAQEGGGGLDLIEMFEQMGPTAIAIAVVLFIMSFWSVGVAIERFYTYSQATKQSKMYAPLVAKGLIRLKATTTSDLDQLPRYDVPDDVSPLDLLLAERAEDDR